MRKAAAALVVLLAVTGVLYAVDRLERTALLILPEEISAQSPFRPAVKLRWNDEQPLEISTWTREGERSTLGEIEVFDEQGNEVQMFFPVSIPAVPNGEITVTKGEVLCIDLDLMGWPIFERAGTYYAIATFSHAWANGVNVRFTTNKRWFKVVERPAKKV